MANMNIRTPRFYVDYTNYFLSRGTTQDGNFDVRTGTNLIAPEAGYSEVELFDMKPLNAVSFDTTVDSGNDHVLVSLDLKSDYKKSFVAILNHNLDSANGKFRIATSTSDITAADMSGATAVTPTEVVNADAISGSNQFITPASDGSTIVRFTENPARYWGIQFEGASSFDGSTKLEIGCILVGEYYDMPHAPDLSVKRSIAFDKNKIQESLGGQRYSTATSFGRSGDSTLMSPFVTTAMKDRFFGGRIIYDLNFSYLNSTDVMPTEYHKYNTDDDSVLEDIWNKTAGSHIPFIFSIDKDSEGSNAESEHIFARFAQDSLDMTQVAPDVFDVSMKIEEEF